jgi:hypothetical protein
MLKGDTHVVPLICGSEIYGTRAEVLGEDVAMGLSFAKFDLASHLFLNNLGTFVGRAAMCCNLSVSTAANLRKVRRRGVCCPGENALGSFSIHPLAYGER